MAEFGFLLALTALSFAALAREYLLGWYPLIDFPIKFWRCIVRRHLTSTNVTYNASIELSCDKLFGIDPDSCVSDTSLVRVLVLSCNGKMATCLQIIQRSAVGYAIGDCSTQREVV
jgi:hypothetical protein